MNKDPEEIFNYLPIRRNKIEDDYIDHLWQSFISLYNSDNISKSFAIMPFHLIFMMVVQYRVLRIFKEYPDKYNLALIIKNPRSGTEGVLNPDSPTTIAFMKENEIIDLLKVYGVSVDIIRKIKNTCTNYRDDSIAHAKGYIEQDLDNKINEYINCLESLQSFFFEINKKVTEERILTAIDGDDMEYHLNEVFLNHYLSIRDFECVLKDVIESEKLTTEQLHSVIDMGLKITNEYLLSLLRKLAIDSSNDSIKVTTIEILKDIRELDCDLIDSIKAKESNPDILTLIAT